MRISLVVAALLMGTVVGHAGEFGYFDGTVRTNLCSGLVNHVPGFSNYTIGNDKEIEDASVTCSFNANSIEGRKILRTCPLESACEVRAEGLLSRTYETFLIRKVFSVKQIKSDYYAKPPPPEPPKKRLNLYYD